MIPTQTANHQRRSTRREARVAVLLVLCVLLVGFWQYMSGRGVENLAPFALSTESFDGFMPSLPGWSVESLPVGNDPLQPNILAYRMRVEDHGTTGLRDDQRKDRGSVLVRLVHGYNMVDCMRIKGYGVEALRAEDRGQRAEDRGQAPDEAGANVALSTLHFALPKGLHAQFWRVTSSTGDVAIWVTSMLRAYDFATTDVDTRSMVFPRVGTPDDPHWVPRGMTRSSLRHPLDGLRTFLRSKWNASRCDPLVFLGLKRPPWASEEMLTLVTASELPVPDRGEDEVLEHVLAAHLAVHRALVEWIEERSGAKRE